MIEAQREERRAEGVQIAADAPRTLNEQILSIQARLSPAHQMLRRLQCIGTQAVSALWPGLPAPRTPSRTANWLEVAAGRLEAWKGSAARAGARRALEFVKAWYLLEICPRGNNKNDYYYISSFMIIVYYSCYNCVIRKL